jgi:hypothetical protein
MVSLSAFAGRAGQPQPGDVQAAPRDPRRVRDQRGEHDVADHAADAVGPEPAGPATRHAVHVSGARHVVHERLGQPLCALARPRRADLHDVDDRLEALCRLHHESAVFTSYTAANIPQAQLGKLHVHFGVSIKPAAPSASTYAIDDDIILCNSAT